MWGQISKIADRLDASFGDDGSDRDDQLGQISASAEPSERNDTVPSRGESEDGIEAGDDDGWGDDDDFGEDFDFDEEAEYREEELYSDIAKPSATENPSHSEIEPVVNGASTSAAEMAYQPEKTTNYEQQDKTESTLSEPQKAHAPPPPPPPLPPSQKIPPPPPPPPPPLSQTPDAASSKETTITVSAPGKALVAGGYLVLEQPNPGLVLAASGCRFHTSIAFRPPHTSQMSTVIGASINAAWSSIPLDIYSPQFDKVFSYYLSYSIKDDQNVPESVLELKPRKAPHDPNKFVERSLLLSLGYLRQSLGPKAFHERLRPTNSNGGRVAMAIKLRADNDFYSQIAALKDRGLDLTPSNLAALEPFLPCPKDGTGKLVVNKTGMGSSAALVTSLVGALLTFFGAISISEPTGDGIKQHEGLRLAHNLAQISHCYAQGKVGSGFDVSAAVYGSHVYTRFSKTIIHPFLESLSSANEGDAMQLTGTLSRDLVRLVDDPDRTWDSTVHPVALPPGLELLMADVCGGSESPSMARKILDWKKSKRRTGFMDDYYWKDLKRVNSKIVRLLTTTFKEQTFLDGLERDGPVILSTRTAEQWKKPMPSSWHEFEGSSWDVALKLLDLRMAILEARQNLKGMGNAASVPVEPDEQSLLADETMTLPGVVAAGVPGAGGYDALFVVYVEGPRTNDGASDHVRDSICSLWKRISEESSATTVCPLSVRASGIDSGLRASDVEW